MKTCRWFLPQTAAAAAAAVAFCTSLLVRRFACPNRGPKLFLIRSCNKVSNTGNPQRIATTTRCLSMMTMMMDSTAAVVTQQMNLLLLDVPSATDQIRSRASQALANVCLNKEEDQQSHEHEHDHDDDNDKDAFFVLGRRAVNVAIQFRNIASDGSASAAAATASPAVASTNQQRRQQQQQGAKLLLQVRQQIQSISTALLQQSHLALCLVMAALCFDDTTLMIKEISNRSCSTTTTTTTTTANSTTNHISRSVASAIASILLEEEANTNTNDTDAFDKSELVLALVYRARALLVGSGGNDMKNHHHHHHHHPFSVSSVDLHIVTQLAKALDVDSCRNNLAAERMVADVIRNILQIESSNDNHHQDSSDGNDDDDDDDTISIYSVSVIEHNNHDNKVQVAAALALTAQLAPWNALCPTDVIDVAVMYELWHAAERICRSTTTRIPVIRIRETDSTTTVDAAATAAAVAVQATQALIDAALEAKTYRRADNYATAFYNYGGQARFLEARYLHACDTIAKVIRKRALPVIEKQVERVDKSVEQVKNDTKQGSVDASLDVDDKCTTTVETASTDIRNFALRQLEESGDIENAHRLANIWNMEYIYDENALQAALAARREKYLQWQDVFPDRSIPDLLSSAEGLISAFSSSMSTKQSVLYGFDVEWGDDHGAAILQVATSKSVVLIDILALSKTVQGTEALKLTVGDLFTNNQATVVGFGCRQDLAKLRATPCASESHWLSNTVAIIDLQAIITKMDPSIPRGLGLSRCCERYLGKPLDKSEQCSLWTRRPLAEQQRVYAALDAYACVAIYKALSSSDAEIDTSKQKRLDS